MRLAWDFIGSEFGNRHQQYEKFYGGASFMNMFRSFDFKSAGALVDNALNCRLLKTDLSNFMKKLARRRVRPGTVLHFESSFCRAMQREPKLSA
jgi:hypothetical protein